MRLPNLTPLVCQTQNDTTPTSVKHRSENPGYTYGQKRHSFCTDRGLRHKFVCGSSLLTKAKSAAERFCLEMLHAASVCVCFLGRSARSALLCSVYMYI